MTDGITGQSGGWRHIFIVIYTFVYACLSANDISAAVATLIT